MEAKEPPANPYSRRKWLRTQLTVLCPSPLLASNLPVNLTNRNLSWATWLRVRLTLWPNKPVVTLLRRPAAFVAVDSIITPGAVLPTSAVIRPTSLMALMEALLNP